MDPRLRGQIRLHLAAGVDRSTIPEQDHRAPQMVQEGLEEGADIQAVEGSVSGQAEGELQVAVSGRNRERADGRELVALEPVGELRRLPLGSPSPFDGGGEGEPALVEEDEMSAQPLSLFSLGPETVRRP